MANENDKNTYKRKKESFSGASFSALFGLSEDPIKGGVRGPLLALAICPCF